MENFKKAVGKKIKERREFMGYPTQEKLASAFLDKEKIKVDRSRISRWETGENFPDPEYREALFRLLDTDESLLDIDSVEENYREKLIQKILQMSNVEAKSLLRSITGNNADSSSLTELEENMIHLLRKINSKEYSELMYRQMELRVSLGELPHIPFVGSQSENEEKPKEKPSKSSKKSS